MRNSHMRILIERIRVSELRRPRRYAFMHSRFAPTRGNNFRVFTQKACLV